MTISKATADRWMRESKGIIFARTQEEKLTARQKAAQLRQELAATADRIDVAQNDNPALGVTPEAS